MNFKITDMDGVIYVHLDGVNTTVVMRAWLPLREYRIRRAMRRLVKLRADLDAARGEVMG